MLIAGIMTINMTPEMMFGYVSVPAVFFLLPFPHEMKYPC